MTYPQVPPDPLPPLAVSGDYANLIPGDAPDGVDEALAQASASVRKYCGWHIAPVIEESWVRDGNGLWLINLPSQCVLDVLSVSTWTSGGGVTPAGVMEPVDLSTVDWSHDGMLRFTGTRRFPTRYRGVQVTARHGYELAAVGDLTALVVNMAARALNSPPGDVRQTIGQVTTQSSTFDGQSAGGIGLSGYDRSTLDGYRLFGVA